MFDNFRSVGERSRRRSARWNGWAMLVGGLVLGIFALNMSAVGDEPRAAGKDRKATIEAENIGLVLSTPEVDLTESGGSFQTNLGVDTVLQHLMPINELYAAGHDLAHPYLSPLFADLTGFPPTILTTGTRDMLLSDTVRMHRALRSAGVDAELHVTEAGGHGGFFGMAPEDHAIEAEIRRFVDRHWGRA